MYGSVVSVLPSIVFDRYCVDKFFIKYFNLKIQKFYYTDSRTSLTIMDASAAGFNTAGIGAFSQSVEVSVP